MKKIISIILLALTLCLVGCNNQYEEYIEKCEEEFIFDYDEKVIAFKTKSAYGLDENGKSMTYLIVEIYGEKTFATYICNKGEVWNYENQSN